MSMVAFGLGTLCVILFFGLLIAIGCSISHAERAKSMYLFIYEVRALDKYIEWEGNRRVKKQEDYKLRLFQDYGQDGNK